MEGVLHAPFAVLFVFELSFDTLFVLARPIITALALAANHSD